MSCLKPIQMKLEHDATPRNVFRVTRVHIIRALGLRGRLKGGIVFTHDFLPRSVTDVVLFVKAFYYQSGIGNSGFFHPSSSPVSSRLFLSPIIGLVLATLAVAHFSSSLPTRAQSVSLFRPIENCEIDVRSRLAKGSALSLDKIELPAEGEGRTSCQCRDGRRALSDVTPPTILSRDSPLRENLEDLAPLSTPVTGLRLAGQLVDHEGKKLDESKHLVAGFVLP
ncbi:hypothetical protein K435DRAFT_872067 [Dendrothele bispora CBS 962.96]|uniref:Uncharacterized protein n=1 Tax=Dendrothele bispora (strain CBS 962.96) TaxID=1314807 RepID=A0A4S8L2Z1_DENBC|nr:hypothetical protein K435DRAFT_872067 [Dendrothele bispora CBS 962.96]